MKPRNEMARALPGVLFMALIGLGALGMGVWMGAESALFLSTAEKTVGTVTRWDSQTYTTRKKNSAGRYEQRTEVRTYPVAAFTWQGTTYEVRSGVSTGSLPVGAQVPIVFQPEDPRQAQLGGRHELWAAIPELILMGMGILVFSWFLLPATHRSWRWPSASGVALHKPRERRASAPLLRIREHVPGQRLVLETASPRRGWLMSGTVGFGVCLAVTLFVVRAPLAGLGVLLGGGVLLFLSHRGTLRQVALTLAGVELRQGFRRQQFARTSLRAVRLEADDPRAEEDVRLWLEPRASEPAGPPAPIEALHASLPGPAAAVRAKLGALREALAALDLRLTEPPALPEARPAAPPSTPGQVAVTRFFRPGEGSR